MVPTFIKFFKWIFTMHLKMYLMIERNIYSSIRLNFKKRKTSVPKAKDSFLEIPYIKGLPLIGTMFDLIASGGAVQLHKYVDMRHKKYGPIFQECIGSEQLIFVASADLMRSVFLHEGKYPRHPQPKAWKLYNKIHKCKRGLFFMEGEEWYHNRRVLNRMMLNGNLSWMDAYINNSTKHLLKRWKLNADKRGAFYEIKDLENQLYRWAIDVICEIMFGVMYGKEHAVEKMLNDFAQIVQQIFEKSSSLMNFPPELAKLLNLNIWREFDEVCNEVLRQGSSLIETFVKLSDEFSREEDSLFQKLQDVSMPLDVIKRIFIDLVIAAGDTTVFTSQWVLYLFSKDIDLQRRILEEAKRKEFNGLIRGLVKETLRLYPVAPFVGRYLSKDGVIGDYWIKKDSLVILSLYTAGRDPAHFSDPLNVMPERWQHNSPHSEVSILQPHASLPFGIGHRSCIGRHVAMKQINALIALVAETFIVTSLNDVAVEPKLRMVTVPNQAIRIAIKLRESI